MYYIDDLDQGAIGERLGLSKSSVSRILSAAKDAGIIEVRIVGDDTVQRDRDLEARLSSAFGLKRAYVARESTVVDPVTAASRLAAGVFVDRAPRAMRIGFGWGLTVQRMIESIPSLRLGAERTLTSLVGGMPTVDTGTSGNNMLVSLAEKSGTRSERFDAPAVVESELTWRALMGETSVKSALERAQGSELAFVGIGTFGVHTSRLVLESMRLSDEERAAFEAQLPAGDMCGHYYRIDGSPIGPPASHRVIGLTLAQLAAIPTVVGIASGTERLNGVRGALATGALDILCADAALARALLETQDSAAGEGGPSGEDSGPDASSEAREFRLWRCPNCGHVHA